MKNICKGCLEDYGFELELLEIEEGVFECQNCGETSSKETISKEELDLIQSVHCPYCHKELDFMSVSYLEGFCIDGCE